MVGENSFLSCKQFSVRGSFWVRDRSLCPAGSRSTSFLGIFDSFFFFYNHSASQVCRRNLMKIFHLGLNIARSLTTVGENSFDDGWGRHWSIRFNRLLLWLIFIVIFLQQNNNILIFFPRSKAFPASGTWPSDQCQACVPFNGVELSSSQKVVG